MVKLKSMSKFKLEWDNILIGLIIIGATLLMSMYPDKMNEIFWNAALASIFIKIF